MLLALMEIVGEVELTKPGRGKMRIHKIQNLNAALEYIKSQGVRLMVSAEEICDSNLTMILGMIWTLILRFDIQVLCDLGVRRARLCGVWVKYIDPVPPTNTHTVVPAR